MDDMLEIELAEAKALNMNWIGKETEGNRRLLLRIEGFR